MKLTIALSTLLGSMISSTIPKQASGVLYGDEMFGEISGGKFWVFNSGGVAIVNPESCEVEDTINSDSDGNLLPGRWYDGVYMENGGMCGDDIDCNRYVVINSAVTLSDTHGEDAGQGEVIFFDTETNKVASRVVVGPRPVHSYAVYTQNEYWTHSDGDGHFYVIDLQDIDKHTGKPVVANVDLAAHGKLLWDESDVLQQTGYATSTSEPHLFVIDMNTHEQLSTFNFTDQVGCFGSHSIGFSSVNKHLYIECTGFGGMLEFDVSTPRSPVLVKQHNSITGSIYESPDESFISVTDKGGSKFHVIQPGPTGNAASVAHTIDIYGHPSGPVFYKGTGNNEDDYNHVCLSLTVNTNQNHYHDTTGLACDYYGCSQATTVDDVEAGICLYATDENGDQTNDLLQVPDSSQIGQVQQGLAPYLQGCNRCTNLNNYDEDDGTCTCTPDCGSCASNENEEHMADLSGAVCLDLNNVFQNDSRKKNVRNLNIEGSSSHPNAATFVAAGSVNQGAPYPYSPQCGFGRTYRPHKRGGSYDVMPTDFPENSVSIVDMETFKLKCQVPVGGSPARVIYVPPSPLTEVQAKTQESSGLSTGAIVGIAIAGLVAVILIVVVAQKMTGGNDGVDQAAPHYGQGDTDNKAGDEIGSGEGSNEEKVVT